MALNLTRTFLLLFISTFFVLRSAAQTTLVQGDLSIIGFNANPSPKNFSFVLWKPVETGTVIKFTDNGFHGPSASTATDAYRNQEQTAVWMAGSNLAAGTVVVINGNSASTGTVQTYNANGNTTTSLVLGNSSGDQIFAFQGDTPPAANNVTFTGRLLFGLYFQAQSGPSGWTTTGTAGSFTSYLPTDLKDSNHIFVAGNATGGQFRLPRNGMTVKEFRAAIADYSNWELATGSTASVTLTTSPFILGTLPLKLISFSGACAGNKCSLYWKTSREEQVRGFSIQTSVDGNRFTTINFTPAKNSFGEEQYIFELPVQQEGSYYRLKIEDQDGSTAYSAVIRLQKNSASQTRFKIFPNEIYRGASDMTLGKNQTTQQNITSGPIQATILNTDGRVVADLRLDGGAGVLSWTIPVRQLAAGTYILRLRSANGSWQEALPFIIR